MDIIRYTNIDLPYWRYLPKYETHPSKSPNKPHIPSIKETLSNFSLTNWKKSKRFLYSIDLFNNKYYWELHEVLENLWLDIGKTTPCGIFIQGIIQISVALLKNLQDNSNGFERMTKKAIPKLQSQSGIYLGININDFIEQFFRFYNKEISVEPTIILIFDKD